ncbi:glycerophosphodiester phosphodiesterase family protein [Sporolactobacillus vineae]|uniref:glycerophosphodiester phosphodiesterase family protein n=1 Tax=Sporolactobacillus vineae TaxID=444463 RepID=UPI000288B357|nr:glycerophosphodiester phosphodiesterase family protein [Sporolactobacillus vineae]
MNAKSYSDPLIIAHRGANNIAPEETLPAYIDAVKNHADFIEGDLRQTKDGVLVLMHDSTVNRTTNGKGYVSNKTYHQVEKLDAGVKFSKKYRGTRVLNLENLIRHFGTKTKYYIETRRVKGKLTMESLLLKILNKYHLISKRKVIIESFYPTSLKKIHKMNKNIPLVLLIKHNQTVILQINISVIGKRLFMGLD